MLSTAYGDSSGTQRGEEDQHEQDDDAADGRLVAHEPARVERPLGQRLVRGAVGAE